jgi:hypothetical protein
MTDEVLEEVLQGESNTVVQGLFFWCEGCKSRHYIPVLPGDKNVVWEWNRKFDKPTFAPSILIYEYEGHQPRCHSYIHGGEIEYLGDCTHEMRDVTKPLLPRDQWPE